MDCLGYIFLLLGLISTWSVNGAPLDDKAKVVKYFVDYGYLRTFSESQDPVRLKRSIKAFQKFAYLPVTGEIDEATLEQMKKPRCGKKDSIHEIGDFRLQGGKWNKNLLTWRLENGGYTVSYDDTRRVFKKSTDLWSKYTNMDFKEVSTPNADIKVKFGRYDHGDLYRFDGRGGTLAHAFYPYEGSDIAGDVHYDDDENFVVNSNKGTELTWVTIHELGHSLGLEHSFDRNAIMYPWYKYRPNFYLDKDDIQGIQSLYGVRKPKTEPPTQPPTQPPTKPPTKPPTQPPTEPPTQPPTQPPTERPTAPRPTGCLPSVTALVRPSGTSWLLVFSGKNFYLSGRNGFLQYGPLTASSYFPRIKEEITAAFTHTVTRRTLFFVPGSYYEYRGFSYISGPKPLSSLGLPSFVKQIDAALVWQRNNKAYFFSENRYWRYNMQTDRLDRGYPRYINVGWKGLPDNLSSATTGLDGITYFVKGNEYFVLHDWTVKVKSGYPRYISDRWLTCSAGNLFGAIGEFSAKSIDDKQGPQGVEP